MNVIGRACEIAGTKRCWVALVALSILLVLLRFGISYEREPSDLPTPSPEIVAEAKGAAGPTGDGKNINGENSNPTAEANRAEQQAKGEPATESEQVDEVIAAFYEYFGAYIRESAVQAEFLDKLRAYLERRYPDESERLLEEIVRRAYPGQAAALMALASQLAEYRQWVAGNELLADLSREERRQLLWQVRAEIFGEEAAEDIWRHELQRDEISRLLAEIGQVPEISFQEKATVLLESVVAVYGESVRDLEEDLRYGLLGAFLELDSVQQDLQSMAGDQRAASLRELRQAAGYGEGAVERLAHLDEVRDQRWQLGQQYMQERNRIISEYEGEDQLDRLKLLGSEYFGEEAATVEAEIQAGFYRFQQKRVYGKN